MKALSLLGSCETGRTNEIQGQQLGIGGGYPWKVMKCINLDAGIFMSFIGLFSYYNFDNWVDQPSDVSANTPLFSTACASKCSPVTS